MTDERIRLTIPADLAYKRLDQALAVLCPQHSRSRLQSWIRAGQVRLDQQVVEPRHRLRGGESVEIRIAPAPAVRACAEDIPLNVVHEDEAVIVLDKPPGLVVHPGAGRPGGTLMNALLHRFPELEAVPRAGIVQRLDRDTSGIMVVARTPAAHTRLVDSMQRREIRRDYDAVVHGEITSGGSIDAPIGRHPVERKRMSVQARGRRAVTHYRVVRRSRGLTHLRVTLETGRTHQIRAHMSHIRHPVVGDPVYGGRARVPRGVSESLRRLVQSFPRQALHASELALRHPLTGQPRCWRAPLPADMQALLDEMAREG